MHVHAATPGTLQVGGVDVVGLAYLAAVLLVAFFPLLLRRHGPDPGESDSESEGGGGGGGPRKPRVPPNPTGPGIPMDDARQALVRLRAPGRLGDHLPAPSRRPSHQPHRRRERTPGGHPPPAA